jgi:hypothetical protein
MRIGKGQKQSEATIDRPIESIVAFGVALLAILLRDGFVFPSFLVSPASKHTVVCMYTGKQWGWGKNCSGAEFLD